MAELTKRVASGVIISVSEVVSGTRKFRNQEILIGSLAQSEGSKVPKPEPNVEGEVSFSLSMVINF